MEKSFADLLEEYLDDEEINLKLKEEEEFCGENINIRSLFKREDCIFISDYVNSYLGIEGNHTNLFHCGLRELKNPYVMGVDNNYAINNPEFVDKGYILLVIDANNNIGTYINPIYLNKQINLDKVKISFNRFKRKRITDLKKIDIYIQVFEQYIQQQIDMDNFFEMLKETKKVKKFMKLKESEKINGKY